jgi:MFS family permease
MKFDSALQPVQQKPTCVRYIVLGFVCTLSMITYIDRVVLASAESHLREALNLPSVANLKVAFTAFALAYAIFEIPTGWLGDVFGPRKTLIRIVLWWSFFTALTGLIGMPLPGGFVLGLTVLVVIRFLFGMGEAGAYPNITRALHNWFPTQERGSAQGAVWMSGRLMGGLTPLLWLFLVEGSSEFVLTTALVSWRQAFWLFGILGLVWCLFFALWFRNRPEEKASVNEAECQLICAQRQGEEEAPAGVPWLTLFTNRNLWILCLQYFCAAYGWYFNITYLPTFLKEQMGVEKTSLVGALYKGGPLWLGALGCLLGGFLTDWFIRRTGNRKWGRRVFGIIGHALCALCYFYCTFAPSAFLFFLGISLAAFWNDLTMGSAWATCQDIGRRYAAIVSGCMNTIGNLGGAVASYATGAIIEFFLASRAAALQVRVEDLTAVQKAEGAMPGYQVCMLTFAAVYAIAVLLWLKIDATRPVVPDKA